MGAVRYRAGPDRGRACRPGLPDARRCAGRCGTLGAAGGGTRGGGDLSERACARDLAEFRGRDGSPYPPRGGKLRAGAGHRRDQPGPCRPCCTRRAAGPQCPLRLGRQRRCCGCDGCMRIPCLQSGCVLLDRHPCCASDLGARPHSHERRRTSHAHQQGDGDRQPAERIMRSPAADICRLHLAVPACQRGHASDHGQYPDHAFERVGINADRGLHRRSQPSSSPESRPGSDARPTRGGDGRCYCSALRP